MTVLALVLHLLGLGLAFGWRSFAPWRATGDTGLHLDAGPVGSVGWPDSPGWGQIPMHATKARAACDANGTTGVVVQ